MTPLLAGPGLSQAPQLVPAGRVQILPTAHPPVPGPDHVWLVPANDAQARELAGGAAGLKEAVQLHLDGRDDVAVARLMDPAWQSTALASYATYYAARSLLRLKRFDEALATLTALVAAQPQGYLSEGAALAAADAASALGQADVALRLYEQLAERKTVATDEVLYGLARAARANGERRKAADALLRVYYEFPLGERARQAAADLRALRAEAGGPGTRATYAKDLDRAQRLLAAARYDDARASLLGLRTLASSVERPIVDLRLAACEHQLRRYRGARDRLRPYLDRASPDQPEALFYYASALRGLKNTSEFTRRMRSLTQRFPDSPWAESALDALATHYLAEDQDERAIDVFREMLARFPSGRRAERAAWKAGWWAYRHGEFADAAGIFDGAAAAFPRSDYRPSYLYWSARARDAMGDRATSRERRDVAIADYGESYFGRLAERDRVWLGEEVSRDAGPARPNGSQTAPGALPPTASLIRLLVAAGLDDAARNELEYARVAWGTSPIVEATMAFVLSRQRDHLRAAIVIKRAYPQFLTTGNGGLPDEVLRIVFPLDYWPIIQRYAADRGLDPHFVAALVGQESMFEAAARSVANAYGLMQLVPSTGRRIGRSIGLRRVTVRDLVNPDMNIRLGTKHIADLLAQFREPYLALAAYNAGEARVVEWLRERPGLPQDEFIDDIPFPETRAYVRRILGTTEDYRRLYPLGTATGSHP
jgi:soluble lytic murein transglycosylase